MPIIKYGKEGRAKPKKPSVFFCNDEWELANWDTLVLPVYEMDLAAWEEEQTKMKEIFVEKNAVSL